MVTKSIFLDQPEIVPGRKARRLIRKLRGEPELLEELSDAPETDLGSLLQRIYPEKFQPTKLGIDENRVADIGLEMADIRMGRSGLKGQVALDTLTELSEELKQLGVGTSWGFKEEELPQMVSQALITQIERNPQAFLEDLRTRGDTLDTRDLLKQLGGNEVTDEDLTNFFTGAFQIPEETRPFSQALSEALPLIVKPRTMEWALQYFGKNPDKLRRELVTAGRTEKTEALVKQLYPDITDRGMRDYFSARVPGTVEGVTPEAIGALPTKTWIDKFKELKDNPAKLIPFVSSGVEIVKLGKLLIIAKDLEDGKEVSQEDLLALKAYVERATMDTTWGYEVADTIAQIVPLAGEFIATGGIFSAGKTATVKAGEQALKRIATKTGLRILEGRLAKYGVEVAGIVAGGTLRTIPAGITRIPASTLEKQLQATLTGDEEAVWQSAVKALGEQWVEVVSESTGGLFAPLAAPIKGQLIKAGLFKAFLKANPGKDVGTARRVFERMGYNGVLAEMLEERVADVGHGILQPLGLSDQKFSIPSARQLTIELASFSVPGMAAMALENTPGVIERLTPSVRKALAEAAEEAKARPERGSIGRPAPIISKLATPKLTSQLKSLQEIGKKAGFDVEAIQGIAPNEYWVSLSGNKEGAGDFIKWESRVSATNQELNQLAESLKDRVFTLRGSFFEVKRGGFLPFQSLADAQRFLETGDISLILTHLEQKGQPLSAEQITQSLEARAKETERLKELQPLRDKIKAKKTELASLPEVSRELKDRAWTKANNERRALTSALETEIGDLNAQLVSAQMKPAPFIPSKPYRVKPYRVSRLTEAETEARLTALMAKMTPEEKEDFQISIKPLVAEVSKAIPTEPAQPAPTPTTEAVVKPEISPILVEKPLAERTPLEMTSAEFNQVYPRLRDLPVAQQQSLLDMMNQVNLEETGENEPLELATFLKDFTDMRFDLETGAMWVDEHRAMIENAARRGDLIAPKVREEYQELISGIEAKKAKVKTLAEKKRLARGGKPKEVTAEEIGITEPLDIEEEVSEEVPPTQPPPPQSVTRPEPQPDLPRDSEIKRIITMSKRQIELNPAGAWTRFLLKIPGVRQALAFDKPALTLNKDVHIAMVAEQQARADVANFSLSSRIRLLRELRDVFGKDVLRGKKSDIKFIGTPLEAANPITGTLKDIADNPELYDLTNEQLGALASMEIHNNTMLDWVVENYGAEIGRFIPKPDGAFLPNVDISEDVIEYLESETRVVATGRGKTRIWATARERMSGKTPFKPELDVQKLIEGLDSFKTSAAAGQTYRTAIGGLTRLEAMETTHPELFAKMMALRKELNSLKGSAGSIESNVHTAINDFLKSPVEDVDLLNLKDNLDVRLKAGKRKGLDMTAIQDKITAVQDQIDAIRPAWQVANLKPYVFVQEGLYRYFPAEMSKDIAYSREISRNKILKGIEMIRAGTFTGDFSPFTIQGTVGVLADPLNSMVVGAGGLKASLVHKDPFRSVRISALGEDIDANPQEWGIFASLRGYTVAGTSPEYAAGYLSKLPGWSAANESVFVSVTRAQFHSWRANYRNMVKHGVSTLDAQIMAMKLASEVYPLANPALLGQSQKRAALLRTMPTSYSFIHQPLELIGETTTGLAKLVAFQKLTPKESLSIKIALTGAASTLAISVTSAALSAIARGDDDEEIINAMWQAIDPDPKNGNFASIIIGGKRIPLGGPYRALFRAFYPQKVEGVPFPVPFYGVLHYDVKRGKPDGYLWNRITPAIRTQLDLLINKDYSGAPILKGNFFEIFLRGLEYEFENVLPLTLGAPLEAVRLGERYKEDIWQQVISQFMGVNLVTLDNTYLDRERKKLGLLIPWEYNEAKPFRVQKQDYYTVSDYFGKVGLVYRDIDPETMTERKGYEPLDKLMVETRLLWTETEKLTNQKLKGLTLEEAELRFENGNISQREYALITDFYNQKDERAKAQFLKDNPGLELNPRKEYLVNNPKQNARLALVGKADLLTKEAYNEFKRLIKEYDIPDSAIPEMTLPPEGSIDNYFKYQALENKQSWEAQLMLAKDEALHIFLQPDKTKWDDTPIASLELKVKNREHYTAYDMLGTDAERKQYKLDNPDWVDDTRRIEAIEKGTAQIPTPAPLISSHVDYGKLQDKEGVGSSSAETMLYRVDNPKYDQWRQDVSIWGDQALKPLDPAKIPIWRIDVKYQKEDAEYESIREENITLQAKLRNDYLLASPNYRQDRRRREAHQKGLVAYIEDYVLYYEMAVKGKRQERFLFNNPDFARALGLKVPEKVPGVAYDDLYDQYPDLFDQYEDADADGKKQIFAENPAFKEAYYRREAYSKFIPENEIDKYVADKLGKGASVSPTKRTTTRGAFSSAVSAAEADFEKRLAALRR